ncbi:MAG TPA: ABC transporter permease subunit [Gemmatimonadales bacterium]|nr:ABC transporter permease subunit [Gemmatimonadales bacterium]
MRKAHQGLRGIPGGVRPVPGGEDAQIPPCASERGNRWWPAIWACPAPAWSGVLLPAALPFILVGLKAAWAFGWRTVVAAELVFGVVGSTGGLGWYTNNNARYYLLVPDICAGLIVISILGIAVDLVFGVIEQRTVVRWGMKTAK